MAPRSYLVAGAGVAGIEAAAAIRTNDPQGRICVIGAEPYPFYTRIRIGELVDGRVEIDRLILRKPDWYDDRNIELRLETRLVGIDVREARAELSDGSRFPWDRLLLATGATSFVPPIPGADLPGVCTLRNIDDALALKKRAAGAECAVVIGGGLLGLEAATSLTNLGIVVTVVDIASWLLPRQLDPAGGGVVQSILERKGLRFRTGATVEAITGDDHVESVDLAGGERIPASLVLVATGIRPETALAREAGLRCDKGIQVDDDMATSAEGIYAAGDCAEHRGRIYGIWPASEAQGRVAGGSMTGADQSYDGTIPYNTLKIAGVAVFSIGDFDPEGRSDPEVAQDGDTYRRLVRKEDGRLTGAVLVGDLKERRRIVAAIENRGRYEKAR